MPLSDLSNITSSLVTLIRETFRTSPAWNKPDLPKVIPEIPNDQMEIGFDVLGFYLYHVQEKKEYSNFPVPVPDTNYPPVRFLPMALTLYYQLSARHYSTVADGTTAYDEQLMMGIAMKALHDYPVIDDSSLINGLSVFQGELPGNDNRFKITYQPIPYGEAVHNWTAGQSPMRLSAYYEVSTVFLEPAEISSYANRVLTYGNYVFTKGAPRITGSQSFVSYRLPDETTDRFIKTQPAQAPPETPPAIDSPASVVSFFGNGFEREGSSVRLINARWEHPALTDASWNVNVRSTGELSMRIRESAVSEKDGAQVAILPGMYSAQVVVARTVLASNGQSHTFRSSSNQFPFTVSPRVDTVSEVVDETVEVTGYLFQFFVSGRDILENEVDIYLSEIRINRTDADVLGAAEFRILDANRIQIKLPAPEDLPDSPAIPLRIIILGAESRPVWILV